MASETANQASSKMIKLAIHKGADAELEVGGLLFRACRREIEAIDGGVTLQVYGPVAGEEEEKELLRFDCFRKSPHYHAPGEAQQETKIDPAEHGDGSEWVYAELSGNLRSLLEQGGFDALAAEFNPVAFEALPDALRSLVGGLAEPSETSHFELDPAVLDPAAAAFLGVEPADAG